MAVDMLRLRIELEDVEPPIWRAVQVPTDLTLDDLHTVIQVAMGWTDSHLHRFTVGEPWDPAARSFVTAEDIAEGERGEPESGVAIGAVLREAGDELRYTYDFGDGWNHVVRLEGTTSSADGAPRCVAGQRACPPEDCGGAPGYEELVHRWSPSRRALADRFDVAEAQRLLQLVLAGPHGDGSAAPLPGAPATSDLPSPVDSLPEPLRDLLARAGGPHRAALVSLVEAARVDRPALVDVATAARMVAPVAWMVGHVRVRGVPLTSAGYLRPDDVQAVAHALRIDREWIGTLNREAHTVPVLLFREALQRAGVLRLARGRLHATRTAAALVDDPVGLWRHLAERLPVGQGAARDAGLLVLLRIAGHDGGSSPVDEAAAMAALGWRHRDGGALVPGDVSGLAEHTVAVLRRCGAFGDPGAGAGVGRSTVPTPEGSALARAALQSWR
ncbi:plasmid pRiA4b ORF-3 family protein [Cellulomonas sp. ATA003]|uniref:plasmid pRiA4b ORF-3 family protein n=1 Tax=Cellulomonas sp. ATA003 TaxID=3073064 RepID=UPI002873733D|nr:plasmid pRiA4b ORF-3 family protein [Cellulomonas sp. ATA003]WNB86501.1 plasmid pRiA4b ORF-3 family protein [Cellulomonas sp. ATA003]